MLSNCVGWVAWRVITRLAQETICPTRSYHDRMGKPAAIVFDIGNVLIRWDPHPAVAAAVGEAEAERFLADKDFDFAAWNHEQDAGRSWDEAEAAAIKGHPQWREHFLSYRRHFDRSMLGPIVGTVSLLRELHAAGTPLFALTNWSAELFPVAARRFDFLALFNDILVSGEVGLAKPAPAIFALLARRTGLEPSHCVFVDDSPANVTAGAAAGFDAILFEDAIALRLELSRRGVPIGST